MQVIRKILIDVIAWDTQAKFMIPKWQRHYAWGNKEVLQMWSDWEMDCARDLKHFCGVMLFRPLPDAPTPSWEIVDGQQRMTTFFIFFVALRDICREKRIDFSELSGIFTGPGGQECRLVLQEGMNEDREVINALLTETLGRVEKKTLDESALYSAYRIFRTKLGGMVPEDIPLFVIKVLQNLDLVVLTVDESDDTRRIFEALNSRGRQVDPDELVSNLIKFINSDDQELNERARSVWNFVLDQFDHDVLADFLEVFAKRAGNQQSERGTVFEEIKFELEDAQEQNRVKEWLREFKRAARNYSDILFPEDSDDPTQRLLKELQRLRVSKINPFLLALLEAFRDTPASQPLIHNLVAAMVRLLITLDRPSYRIEKFTQDACFAFHETNISREAQLEKVITLIDSIWIDDETFHKAFTMKSIYGPGAHLSRLRYYLEKLEQKMSESSGMPFEIHFGSDTTVEHIMPQTLDEGGAWRNALRTTDTVRLESQHKALMHTIGNLTVLLTKDNPAAGNTAYSQKREFYLHPNETLSKLGIRRRKIAIGNCALNSYFEGVPSWNFQTIAIRSRYLADLALQIWNKENWNRETI
jgi:hypoxanthine phosphoribosyltransferase